MEKTSNEEYCIPVVICSNCKKESLLTHRSTLSKEGFDDIEIWSTVCCDIVPREENEIIGYKSIAEIEKEGWVKQSEV